MQNFEVITGSRAPIKAWIRGVQVENTVAWFIPKCPDFYFMPSLWIDTVFCEWGDRKKHWNCPDFWHDWHPKIKVIPCHRVETSAEALCFKAKKKNGSWEGYASIKGHSASESEWEYLLNCVSQNSEEVVLLNFDIKLLEEFICSIKRK